MIALVTFEIVLRVFGLTDPVLHERDAAVGYRPRPAQRASYVGDDIVVNERGVRDAREFEGPPPPGTLGILVLGDSVTWGGVRFSQETLFTTTLERNPGVRGRNAEVLNAGVSGYWVLQMAALYETHLADLEPDLVLVHALPHDFRRPPRVDVTHEETVYGYTPPNNGSGPFWSFGCTTIARVEDDVYVSEMETGRDVPPLCNTRWRLHKRTQDGWTLFAEAEDYRQREPAVLGTTGTEALYLNVNDSTEPPGTNYGPCTPYLLKFNPDNAANPAKLMPHWEGEPYFTDHSYRGFAADREANQLLMLNIDAKTSEQNWCHMTAGGETLGNGKIVFPIRACYPQAALKDGAAYVLAIGDIREPVKEWADYKFEQTQREWDYVFRILYFTWTRDIHSEGFGEPIEIANVDVTAGHITNQDLWIAPNGDAYIMYTERPVSNALMRDKFFPEMSILDTLHLVVVRKGEILSREVLLEGTDTRQPGTARFHVTENGDLYAMLYAVIDGTAGNYLTRVSPPLEERKLTPVPLQQPLGTFLLANARAGNAPSNTIDLVGSGSDNTIVYAQIQLEQQPQNRQEGPKP